ncbi:MAG: tetratricopeptide (TPR) repeat protein [Polyangiales bacterium]|jgi:tetratricopeptide (TPR) repeat protein
MRLALTFALVLCVACGAAPEIAPATIVEVELEPSDYLLRWAGQWHAEVARPVEDSATLEESIRGLRGSERHTRTLRYITALLYEIEELNEGSREVRLARREVRRALRRLRRVRGELATTRDFLELVAAWRGALPRAVNLAERFTDRHSDSAELHGLAWMILGEIYFEGERWSDAARSFRYLLGDLEHPLYAFASWRTAAVLREQGRAEEADEMLPQIVRLACASDTPEPTQEVAAAVAAEARIARVSGRFAACEGDEREGNMDEELPPGYR